MTTMQAWQFSSASGGLENNLFLPAGGAPRPKVANNDVLVEVFSMAINPADYKFPEMGLMAKAMFPSRSIPGMDFCGRIVETGSKVDSYKIGEIVFGAKSRKLGYGSLGQFMVVSTDQLALMPEGVQVDHAAAIGVAGTTAYQSIKPNVQEGDKIFINGGSGGTGVWGIQIAKALGCHVTTSCSTANVELCKRIGADEVIDYKTDGLIKTLQEKGKVFTLVVDNAGSPTNLYKVSNAFLIPTGKFVQVSMNTSLGAIGQLTCNFLRPGFLGGGKARYKLLVSKPTADSFKEMGTWMKEGKLKAVIDSTFEFDDVPKAFVKLKTGRAKGKIVVHVKKH